MTALDRLVAMDAVSRLAHRDASLFSADESERLLIAQRLGWIGLAERVPDLMPYLIGLAEAVCTEGARDVLLLGMGGSSLAPLVMADVIGNTPGFPRLHVLDTTSPTRIRRLLDELDPRTTYMVLSSKSGTTIEPRSLHAIVREWLVASGMSADESGRRCIVVTDPGSPLEQLRRHDLARAVLVAPPTVGGRYSALSVFGLAPAALIGIDVGALAARAAVMERACNRPAAENPAAQLAAWIADAWEAGRDKLTLVCSEELRSFGLWLEQLIAESIGKNGRGVVPVVECGDPTATRYDNDRAVVVVRYRQDTALDSWSRTGAALSTVCSIVLTDPYDLGAEFVRWEYATALLGALARVNPFNEPNVAMAKQATGAILDGASTEVPSAQCDVSGTWITFAGGLKAPAPLPETRADAIRVALLSATAPSACQVSPASPVTIGAADYLALLVYPQSDEEALDVLRGACAGVSAATGRAVCLEAGPRYLHSTGQLHKGGPNSGVFIMITGRDRADIAIPGAPYTLAELYRAQAEGDLLSLAKLGRRVLRLDLPSTDSASLEILARDLVAAASPGRSLVAE